MIIFVIKIFLGLRGCEFCGLCCSSEMEEINYCYIIKRLITIVGEPTLRWYRKGWLMVIVLFVVRASLPASASIGGLNGPKWLWQHMPSDKLIELGKNYQQEEGKLDSALYCYTIAAARYRKEMNQAEKQICCEAYYWKWHIYFFGYYDYTKAYENLSIAEEIAKEVPAMSPRIYFALGSFFQTISEQGLDKKEARKSLDYYLKGFRIAKDNGKDPIDLLFVNAIQVAHYLHDMPVLAKDWERYERLDSSRSAPYRPFARRFYKAILYYESGKYPNAARTFRDLIEHLPAGVKTARLATGSFIYLGKLEALMGNYDEAILSLKQAESISNQWSVLDGKLEACDLIASYYTKLGQHDEAESYRNRYYKARDALYDHRQLMSMNEMQFSNQMRRIDQAMQESLQKQERQRLVSLVAIGIVFIVLVFSAVLWRNLRKLRRSNATLYKKNESMIKAEEEAKKRREELEDLLREYERKEGNHTESMKYKGSVLDEDDKELLLLRIQDVMETSKEIYSPSFSAEQLALLVGSKYKYVSQVINEKYNCNFSTYLNEYRIREACKRISNYDSYGNLTFEAISNSVGFKSRTSFINSFKRFTGLTPSEYQRQAKYGK